MEHANRDLVTNIRAENKKLREEKQNLLHKLSSSLRNRHSIDSHSLLLTHQDQHQHHNDHHTSNKEAKQVADIYFQKENERLRETIQDLRNEIDSKSHIENEIVDLREQLSKVKSESHSNLHELQFEKKTLEDKLIHEETEKKNLEIDLERNRVINERFLNRYKALDENMTLMREERKVLAELLNSHPELSKDSKANILSKRILNTDSAMR